MFWDYQKKIYKDCCLVCEKCIRNNIEYILIKDLKNKILKHKNIYSDPKLINKFVVLRKDDKNINTILGLKNKKIDEIYLFNNNKYILELLKNNIVKITKYKLISPKKEFKKILYNEITIPYELLLKLLRSE